MSAACMIFTTCALSTFDDVLGRSGRREQAVPLARFVAFEARFGDGRQVFIAGSRSGWSPRSRAARPDLTCGPAVSAGMNIVGTSPLRSP